jgi:hypothetical protein
LQPIGEAAQEQVTAETYWRRGPVKPLPFRAQCRDRELLESVEIIGQLGQEQALACPT